MKVSIDTKEDSHDDIKKVIKMLQNIVGDSQEIFTNQPSPETAQAAQNPFANIFGDTSRLAQQSTESSETAQTNAEETSEASESTEDLFAELFSEEELKKMGKAEESEDEEESEEEVKPKDKKYGIEFY